MWGNSPTSSTSAFASRLKAEMGQSASSLREQFFQKLKQNMTLKGQQEGPSIPVPGDRWAMGRGRGLWRWGWPGPPSRSCSPQQSSSHTACCPAVRTNAGAQSKKEGSGFWPRSREVHGYGREVSLASQWAEGPLPVRVFSSSVSRNLHGRISPKLHPPLSKEWLQATRATHLQWNLNWLKWNEIQNSVAVATFQTLHSHKGLVATKLDSTECFHHHKKSHSTGTPKAAPCL